MSMTSSESRSSLPIPEDFHDDATRALFPRQLIIYDEQTNRWSPCTDETILATTEYLAISYRQTDFPDKVAFENVVRITCQILQLSAYWLDFACTGESPEEKNRDLYRIADVFRGAKKTVIMINGEDDTPLSEGWLSWGDRIWTLPEALLSQEVLYKVGTRFVKSTNLRVLANVAYKDRHEEIMLIQGYSGKDPLPVPEKVELLRKAIWKRSSGPSRDISNSSIACGMFTAYPAERVYALMGFMQYRIVPDINESEEEAFVRLMQVNKLEGHCFSWGAHIPPSIKPAVHMQAENVENLAGRFRSQVSLDSSSTGSVSRQSSLPSSLTPSQLKATVVASPRIPDTLREDFIKSECYEQHFDVAPLHMFKDEFDDNFIPAKPTEGVSSSTSTNKTTYLEDAKDITKRFLTWTTDSDDVEKAIHYVKKTWNKARHNYNKGLKMKTRYQEYGDVADLDSALSRFEEATHGAESDDSYKMWYYNETGLCLLMRFYNLGIIDDLTKAIVATKEAVKYAKDSCPPVLEHNLLTYYRMRYKRLNNIVDLHQGITSGERAVQLSNSENQEVARYKMNLASCLRLRYVKLKDVKDLGRALTFAKEALQAFPSWCPPRALHRALAATILTTHYDISNDIEDLNHAIILTREGISMITASDQNKELYLRNFASMLRQRYSLLYNVEDLNEAIANLQRALQTLKEDSDVLARYHTFLATTLKLRFDQTANLADLDLSIANQEKSIQYATKDNLYKPLYMHLLASVLHMRFERTGNFIDIDQAIQNDYEAVQLAPKGDKYKPCFYRNLGLLLRARFDCLHDLSDLEQAIVYGQEAVHHIGDGHPEKPLYLDNLGRTLRHHFIYSCNRLYIDRAVACQQEAVRRTTDNDDLKPRFLCNLANSLENRYDVFLDKMDLEEAVARRQEAIQLAGDNNKDETLYFNDLIQTSEKFT